MKKNLRDIVLVSIIAISAMVFLFYVPPFSKADESTHFVRINQIINGYLFCSKNKASLADSSLIDYRNYLAPEKIIEKKDLYLDQKDTLFYPSQNMVEIPYLCTLNPLPYSFLIVPAFLLKKLNTSYNLQVYVLRGVVLIFYLAVVWLSVRKTSKVGGNLIILFSLLPLTLHDVTKVGYDVLLNMGVVIILGYLFRTEKKPKDLLWLAAGFILALITRITYLPLILIFWYFVLKSNLSKKIQYILIASTLVMSMIYAWINIRYFSTFHALTSELSNSALQINYIISDFGRFLGILVNDLWINGQNYLLSAFGGIAALNYNYAVGLSILLVLSMAVIAARNSKYFLEYKLLPLVLLTAAAASFFLIQSVSYVSFSAVGANFVNGIQGRYIISLIVLCVLGGVYILKFLNKYTLYVTLTLFLLISILVNYTTIYDRFYNDKDFLQYVYTPIIQNSEGKYKVILANTPVRMVQLKVTSQTEKTKFISYKVYKSDCATLVQEGYLHPSQRREYEVQIIMQRKDIVDICFDTKLVVANNPDGSQSDATAQVDLVSTNRDQNSYTAMIWVSKK